jgi:hypothetical protein
MWKISPPTTTRMNTLLLLASTTRKKRIHPVAAAVDVVGTIAELI